MNEVNKIRAVIVDDEPLARRALRALLAADSEIEIVAECGNGRDAVSVIRAQNPDVVFLDVQMPDADGFEVVKQIGAAQMPVIVFVTAYDQYALRAFAAHALDYLLKPFDHERFDDALKRAKHSARNRKIGALSENLFALLKEMGDDSAAPDVSESAIAKNAGEPARDDEQPFAAPLERLTIKADRRIYFLKVEEIDWIEATGDYARLHTAGGKTHLMRETMSRLHARLDRKKFIRIHRSIIVNVESVTDIQPLFKSEFIFTLNGGKRLKSGRGYRSEFQALLDEAR